MSSINAPTASFPPSYLQMQNPAMVQRHLSIKSAPLGTWMKMISQRVKLKCLGKQCLEKVRLPKYDVIRVAATHYFH